MTVSEYAERDPRELEPHFSKHMEAMTAEKLHSKAAIAEELAYRDAKIERLTAENERLKIEHYKYADRISYLRKGLNEISMIPDKNRWDGWEKTLKAAVGIARRELQYLEHVENNGTTNPAPRSPDDHDPKNDDKGVKF